MADIPLGLAGFDRPISRLADRVGTATGFQPGKWEDETNAQLSTETQAQQGAVDTAWKDPNTTAWDVARAYIDNPRATAMTVARSIAPMFAGGLAGRALGVIGGIASGPARAAIGEGSIIAGGSMKEIDPAVDPQRAALASLGAGALGGVVGYGGGRIAQRFGFLDPDVAIAGGARTAGAVAPPIYKRVPSGMVSEALFEEGPQSAIESAAKNWAEGKPITEGMARAVTEGALAGAVLGGGFAAIPPPSGPITAATNTVIPPPAPPLSAGAMGYNNGPQLGPMPPVGNGIPVVGPISKIAAGLLPTALLPTDSTGNQSIGVKQASDGGSVNPEGNSDFGGSTTTGNKGFDVIDSEAVSSVKRHMLAIGKNDEVLKAVIKLIPVDVVNVLSRQKLTPEMLFHDPSMLDFGGVRGDGDNAVTIGVDASSSIMRLVASVAAKHPALLEGLHSADLPIDGLATTNAGIKGAAGFVDDGRGRSPVQSRTSTTAEDVGRPQNEGRVPSDGGAAPTTLDSKHAVTPTSNDVPVAGDASTPPATPIVGPSSVAKNIIPTTKGDAHGKKTEAQQGQAQQPPGQAPTPTGGLGNPGGGNAPGAGPQTPGAGTAGGTGVSGSGPVAPPAQGGGTIGGESTSAGGAAMPPKDKTEPGTEDDPPGAGMMPWTKPGTPPPPTGTGGGGTIAEPQKPPKEPAGKDATKDGWDAAAVPVRAKMLRDAGYVDGDQIRQFSNTPWDELDPVIQGKVRSPKKAEPSKTQPAPPTPKPPAAEDNTPKAKRIKQSEVFNALANDPDMVGKSREELIARVTELLGDTKLAPFQIQRLVKVAEQKIKVKQAELEKQKHRKPEVRQGAIDDAMKGIDPVLTPEQQVAFTSGWDHALRGKTKSTMHGGEMPSRMLGYKAGRRWMKTTEGNAWYEGVPVNKLENTGVDLRRWYEQLRDQMKADESDATTAWAQIERATARASLFEPLLPDGVSPGFRLYIEHIRGNTETFKEWLDKSYFWLGNSAWRNSDKSNTDYMLEGDRYPGNLTSEDRDKFQSDSAYRIKWLQDVAAEYVGKVRALIEFAQGKSSVKEAAEQFDERYVDAAKEKEHDAEQRFYSSLLNDKGLAVVNSKIWRPVDRDFQQLRSKSEWTKHLIENEKTIALPTRNAQMIPPRLDIVVRDGPELREGKDVTPEGVKTRFSFADIGFGTYVKAKEDQDHLNYSHDAFVDLASHVGASLSGIGFGGKMHFLIGALGRGKFAATFHPAHPSPNGPVKAINVTNTKGDGTLAHEWHHAIDDMMGGDWATVRGMFLRYLKQQAPTVDAVEKRAMDFLFGGTYWTHLGDRKDKVNHATYAMTRGFSDKSTAYKQNADILGKKYWGNDKELFARAGEAWVADTLGFRSDYLVNAAWVGEGNVTKAKGFRGTPYPTGTERALFNKLYATLFKSITWKDGKPTVSREAFEKNLPEEIQDGQRRMKDLSDPENMRVFYQEEIARRAQEAEAKTRAEQEELDRLAEEKEAELAPPIVDAPAEPSGDLTDTDLENLFDEAAAELSESEQETPDAPPEPAPKADSGAWTPEKLARENPTAANLIGQAAQLGVTGINEALTGLAKLFGSKPGRLNSFPGGFDEDAYKEAKPHFSAALKAFQDAGKTLKELFKFLIEQFGDGIKEYAIRFAKDEGLTAQLGAKSSASMTLAKRVQGILEKGLAFDWRALFEEADEAFGGTQAEGKYTPKDAYDAMEAGVNLHLMRNGITFNPNTDRASAILAVESLKKITALLPTQTKRTEEMDKFQQFSTVPPFAFIANWAANVTSADTMLEPSAGIGGLTVFAKNAGAKLILNELSSRRAAVLQDLFPGATVYHENAEHISNFLPDSAQPTVVVMNPPFSAAANNLKNNSAIGAKHIEQGLSSLVDGGRLVAISGEGMEWGKPAFREWWARIAAKHHVRAVIPVDGSGYAKYGTTFNNVLIVIDKVAPPKDGAKPITTGVSDYTELIALLEGVRNDRPNAKGATNDRDQLERDDAESERDAPDDAATPDGPAGPIDTGPTAGVGAGEPGGRPGVGGGRGGGGGGGGGGRPGGRLPQPGKRGNRDSEKPGGGGQSDPDAGSGPDTAGGATGVNVGSETTQAGELTDSIFEGYTPQRLQVEGAKPHPGALVQSAAMASVLPPAPTYTPNLPKKTITDGLLSLAQIEAVVYAGQAHEQLLPRDSNLVEARRGFFIGDGTGPQPLTAKVLTPTGWRTMGDLVEGDEVIAVDGTPTRVTGVFPQGVLSTYKLTFSDGSSTEASGEHLWLTQTRQERSFQKQGRGVTYGPPKLRTTDMLATDVRKLHSIPLVAPVQFPKKPVSINPWLLGVLLGDGCLRQSSAQLVCAEPEMVEMVEAALPHGLMARKVVSRDYHYDIVKAGGRQWSGMDRQSNPLLVALRNLGLAGAGAADKFIPDDYKINSVETRLAILRGLMDTDGHAAKHNGSAIYYTISARLADDVVFLCRSLGGVATRSIKKTTHRDCHVVYVKLPSGVNPFSLGRKATRVRASWEKYSPQRILRSVEPIGERECQCISVAHDQHLYLTDDLIVTHNTGKGRMIGGILLDNLRQGRKKHVWVSEKQGLMNDAKRDFKGVGGDESIIFNQNKTGAEGKIDAKNGIIFTTYSTLRSAAKSQRTGAAIHGMSVVAKGQSRLDQLVNWLGKDFDGVIAFDEAHNAGNAIAIKGERGASQPSAQAMAVVELQKQLPKARVVYVSATGATEVSNLSFATRLGLWGMGTPFPSVHSFVEKMVAGGLATMELVARDMKQMGAYIARSLSFDGVTYSRAEVEHKLTPLQRDIYNKLAEAWQLTLRRMNEAMSTTDAAGPNGEKKPNRAKANMKSAYWGAQQRFFNQIITSMQMPTIIDAVEQDLKAGDAVLLQLVNTNEAQQERALAKRAEDDESDDLEDLDLTPRDQLLEMVAKAFPVIQYEDDVDPEGNRISVPVMNADGTPMLNKEAVKMREQLLKDLREIRVPDGPLEIILNHFGPDITAEVTGRKQRVVRKPDKNGDIKAQIEQRGASAAKADAEAFMADKKRIIVYSDAGGTGYSFHADRTQKNQRKRQHYLIQPGWRANKAVQGMGRSHRTNQASEPHYKLASTDIPAHKRFLSAIARRLDQLGALTKGQRDTSSGGLFNESDNLESKYATQATRQLVDDIKRGQVVGVSFVDFLEQMGLEDIVDPNTGNIAESKYPPTRQFLNRLLSMGLEMQELVFAAFMSRIEEKVEVARSRGELDTGMQTIKAIETKVTQEEVIHTDPRTGAETTYVELEVTQPNRFYSLPSEKTQGAPIEWVVNVKSGRIWAKVKSGTITNKNGSISDRYRMLGTGGTTIKVREEFEEISGGRWVKNGKYRAATPEEAEALWDKETQARPPTFTEKLHMIVGAMLPIWDRLETDGTIQVARTNTVDGRRLLGKIIHPKDVDDIKKRLNISAPKIETSEVMRRILRGEVAELANGWKLARAKVSDELRIEIGGNGRTIYEASQRELVSYGVIKERIAWAERLFVPVGPDGWKVLDRIFETKPLVELKDPNKKDDGPAARNDGSNPPAASRKAGRTNTPNVGMASMVAAQIKSKWKNGPKIVVVSTASELPANLRGGAMASDSGGSVEGLFDNGTVYLVADRLPDARAVRRVVMHETLGHFGLRGVFGAGLNAVLDGLIAMNGAKVKAAAARLKIDYDTLDGRREAAEELLAYMAQNEPTLGWVRRAVAAIRTWLRENIPGLSMGLSDAEIIRDYLLPARAFVEGGGPAAPGGGSRVRASTRAPTFFSALSREIATLEAKALPAMGWMGAIKSLINKGKIKQDEVTWSGIEEWLGLQEGRITKEQVAEYLDANGVQVKVVTLEQGGEKNRTTSTDAEGRPVETMTLVPDRTKFSKWRLPGGIEYKEELMTLAAPTTENKFKGGHWAERNVLAHVRRDVVIGDDGKSYVRVIELQSDWQAASKKKGSGGKPVGFATPFTGKVPKITAENLTVRELLAREGAAGQEWLDGRNEMRADMKERPLGPDDMLQTTFEDGKRTRLTDRINQTPEQAAQRLTALRGDWLQKERREHDAGNKTARRPPAAPFVTHTDKWLTLALKRIMVAAAQEGHDGVVFITGDQAADMFALINQVDTLVARKQGGSYAILAEKDGDTVIDTDVKESELEATVGKDLAARIIADGGGEYSGLDLKVGGEGMLDFYDKIVPIAVNKLLAKLGGGAVADVAFADTDMQFSVERHADGLWYVEDASGQASGAGHSDKAVALKESRDRGDRLGIAPPGQQPGFTITDKMRENVRWGLPLFSKNMQRARLDRLERIVDNARSGVRYSRAVIAGQTNRQYTPAAGQTPLGLTGGANGTWVAPEPSKLDNLIYFLQDKMIDGKRVLEAVVAQGQAIADALDVYLQEELYYGRAAKGTHDFIDKELRPLIEDVTTRGVKMDDFEAYLHARHAEEANDAIETRDPTVTDGSGMETQEAADYLSNLDPATKRAYESLAVRVDAITAKTRQTWVDYGLTSRDDVAGMEQAFQHYVPLHRESMENGPGIGQGFSIRGPETRRRKGSKRAVVNILANIAIQREKAVVRGEKNRVGMALYGLAKMNPNSDFWKIAKPGVTTAISTETGSPVDVLDMSYQGKENVIMFRAPDGTGRIVQRGVEFNERDPRALRMARTLKNLDGAQLGEVLGTTAKATRYFASINTQYNPVFGVVNLVRDLQGAMLNLTTTPIAGKQAAVLSYTLSALRGIYIDARDVRAGNSAVSAWAQEWEEFQNEGGQTGFRDLFRTSQERAEEIQREFKKASEGKFIRFGRAVFDWLSDYNAAMENAVRLAAYKVGKEQGMTKQRAASMAKNLTVNFNRKGEIGLQAGALYAFFNASVQGTARLAKTLKGPAGKKIIAGGALLGVMQALALAAAGFDDEEPPDFVRERNLILPIGGKEYLTVPMPLGLHVIPGVGRIAAEFTLSGFRNPAKRIGQLVSMVADAFNPTGNAGLSIQTVTPTVLDPLAALSENKDWTGRPIAREDFNKLNPTPGFTRAKDTASSASKMVSQALNYISGGSHYKPGLFSPTPDQIDYLIGQLTGGVGREAMKAEQTVASAFTGEDLPTYKVPLLGRFYGDAEQQSSQSNAFYNNLKAINEHEAELKGRRKAGEPTAEYLTENPEARLVMMANAVERDVSQLRKRKRELMAKDASKESVKLIEQQIANKQRRFNEAVRSVTDRKAA